MGHFSVGLRPCVLRGTQTSTMVMVRIIESDPAIRFVRPSSDRSYGSKDRIQILRFDV